MARLVSRVARSCHNEMLWISRLIGWKRIDSNESDIERYDRNQKIRAATARGSTYNGWVCFN